MNRTEISQSIEQPVHFRPDLLLVRYLAALKTGKLVLWCYLLWYINMTSFYFEASPRLWLSSLGISFIVGVALILSTTTGWDEIRRMDRWQMLRLFLMPFCVSSFAAMIKGKDFILFFSPNLKENLLAASCCLALCVGVFGIKRLSK